MLHFRCLFLILSDPLRTGGADLLEVEAADPPKRLESAKKQPLARFLAGTRRRSAPFRGVPEPFKPQIARREHSGAQVNIWTVKGNPRLAVRTWLAEVAEVMKAVTLTAESRAGSDAAIGGHSRAGAGAATGFNAVPAGGARVGRPRSRRDQCDPANLSTKTQNHQP